MKELLILSGKGGTGKTTVAGAFIKLAEAKAYADCDVDAPNLHLTANRKTLPEEKDFYGLPKALIDKKVCINCGNCQENCRFGAIDVVDGFHKVNDNACEGCAVCTLVCPVDAISMTPAVAGKQMLYKENDEVFSTAKLNMGSGNSGLLVTEVKKNMQNASTADFAIIDGSPGLGCPVIASISGVDMILAVSEPSVSGISDLERVLKTAAFFNVETAVCINKYDTNLKISQDIENYCKENNIPFTGKIPFDNSAMEAINSGKTIVDIECESKKAVTEIFKNTMAILSK